MSFTIRVDNVPAEDVGRLLEAIGQARDASEPLAEWEKDLLAKPAPAPEPVTPRVATWKGDFKVGQLVALRRRGVEAFAEIVEVEPYITLRGRYLDGEEVTGEITGPFAHEIDAGQWVILREGKRPWR